MGSPILLLDGMDLKGGLEKGRMEANLAAARKMKEMGMPADAIAKCTGISAEEIEGL